ncbi:hypothetical protein H8F21_13365 [Pseudomonas sp. P66]|uniref:Glyoxalase-related protein domain-containing protein n=1 Tax=Pseudomonas arcuscaelestis TaxID=2710591 RepID=A0ABS2BY61_9PSED|nr:glyoxalase superfamily protein [Pseudomonas arcuscaelestis]MBM5458552.1 hypothetical protein [Pseudomonas arcuscaelestis]
MQTVAQFKKRADRLRTLLQEHGFKVTRAVSLEAQAAQEGVRDWNTLSSLAANESKAPKVKKSSLPLELLRSPANSYQHLAEWIGKDLPAKPSPGLQAELEEIEQAINDGALFTSVWKKSIPVGWDRYWCCKMESDIPKDLKCRLCGIKLRLESCNFFRSMMSDMATFQAVRRALSHAVERSILGLVPYVLFDHQPSILERVCRVHANGIVHVAAKEFGLDHHLTNVLSDRLHPGRELGLGYYPDTRSVMATLSENGISSDQAHSLGWLRQTPIPESPKTHPPFGLPYGLVVTFLEDASGGPASFWGYRPKSLRARDGEGSDPYVVGMGYPRDAVYLSHLIDERPVVLVTGFMHALTLRDRGVNAVAVPYLGLMSKAAVEAVFHRDGKVVVATTKSHYNSESGGGAIYIPELKKRLLHMNELETYEGPKGFMVDRFLEDLNAIWAGQSGAELS